MHETGYLTKENGRWKHFHYFIKDHLGNNRLVVNQSGAIVQSLQYEPFGMTFADGINAGWQPYKFGGKEEETDCRLNWYDFESRLYVPDLGRFMQPDPLAEKYYSISPYAYCMNNPIRFIDPFGKDVWEINEEGRIINRIKDKTQDAFYMLAQDADGNYQRTFTTDADGNKNYNSISFKYGTIESQRSISYSPDGITTDVYDVYKVRGDDKGTALFEFLGNNVTGSSSMVEIGQAKTGIEGNKGLNFITTGHERRSEPGSSYILSGQLFYGYTVRELNHTHPVTPGPSSSDNMYKTQVGNFYRSRGMGVPNFNIYHVPTRTTIPY